MQCFWKAQDFQKQGLPWQGREVSSGKERAGLLVVSLAVTSCQDLNGDVAEKQIRPSQSVLY